MSTSVTNVSQKNTLISLSLLPTEIWIMVFTNLEYFDLLRCSRVDKHFRSITKHHAFDAKLFRGTIQSGAVDMCRTKLHPCFQKIWFGCGTDIDSVWTHSHEGSNRWGKKLLKDTKVGAQHATNPPVKSIWIRHEIESPRETTNKTGVTVLQVMKALCRTLDKQVGGELRGLRLWDLDKMPRVTCDCSHEDRRAKVGDLLEYGEAFAGFYLEWECAKQRLICQDLWDSEEAMLDSEDEFYREFWGE